MSKNLPNFQNKTSMNKPNNNTIYVKLSLNVNLGYSGLTVKLMIIHKDTYVNTNKKFLRKSDNDRFILLNKKSTFMNKNGAECFVLKMILK